MLHIYKDGRIIGGLIGRVTEIINLDYWDGINLCHGGKGRHLGLTVISTGDLVLIHMTHRQGERDWAEVVSEDEVLQAILRADATHLLDEPRFKKLKELYEAKYKEQELI